MLLHENKITKAIDKGNFDQVIIDKDNNVTGGFFSGIYTGKDNPECILENEKNLVKTYRKYAAISKVDEAIQDITNEAIVVDEEDSCAIHTERIDFMGSPSVAKGLKEKILPEIFSKIYSKLKFDLHGDQYFERWYVDGRLYVYVDSSKEDGIKDIRILDPLRLTLVRENKKLRYDYQTGEKDENGCNKEPMEIPFKNVIYITSGLHDAETGAVISYINKAIKPINQLQMMENSLVIHRFIRAPERWLFKLDTSGMSDSKATEYMRKAREQFRSRFSVDPITGETKSQSLLMSMQENFFIAKRNTQGGGHEIDTIGGSSQGFDNIDPIIYFQKEMYKALNVPVSRLEPENTTFIGSRTEEINRDELNFFKFIKKLRKRGMHVLFMKLIELEGILTGRIKKEDYDAVEDDIRFVWRNESIYEQARESSTIQSIIENSGMQAEELAHKYFSVEWFRKKVLKQTDEQIAKYDKQRQQEIKSGIIPADTDEDDEE